MTLLDAWWKKRSFIRSWVGVRGRLNRLLPDAGLLELILVGHLIFYKLLKRPVLFHVHRFDGYRGILWASRLRLPVVHTEHASPTGEYRVWWDQLKPVINRAALVIAVSKAVEAGIRQYCGFQGEIRVIPGMVEYPGPIRSRPSECGRAVVGFAGRLADEKGVEFLLQAVPQVLECCPDVRFLIAGDGERKDGLLRLAKSLGIEAQVEFMGRYDADQLETFMSRIDITVLPSLTESQGLVLIEAMAYGKPIVATEVGGIPEVVQNGISGRLVPPRDPGALANAILSLVNDPEERYRLGMMGRQLYECCYTPPIVLEQILAAYQSVLRRSNS
jgi:glycosyltransferase involved in cell wall biosynthesis